MIITATIGYLFLSNEMYLYGIFQLFINNCQMTIAL